MNAKTASTSHDSAQPSNGSGAAAILAAGIGSLMVALLAIAADKWAGLKNMMVFYKPTGPLSGVTTCAIAVWILMWVILEMRWRRRTVAVTRVTTAALVLLGLSLLLTFPPIADLF
jgi:hypothetical protein